VIEPIDDMPEGVLGFEGIGLITTEDYRDAMEGPVKAAGADGTQVSMLFLLGNRFEKFQGGAMWEDARFGLTKHVRWNRIAFVTDVDWLRRGSMAFRLMIPGKFKLFRLAELDAAKAWTAAS
jgi:stage II sporulation SpoAA-like protein